MILLTFIVLQALYPTLHLKEFFFYSPGHGPGNILTNVFWNFYSLVVMLCGQFSNFLLPAMTTEAEWSSIAQ